MIYPIKLGRSYAMNNEEILKAAQKEKHKGKEFENREGLRSTAVGAVVSLFLTSILLFLQYFVKGTINMGFLSIGVSSAAAQYLYEGIKIKKKSSLVIGIITTIIAIFFTAVFVAQLFAKVWMV